MKIIDFLFEIIYFENRLLTEYRCSTRDCVKVRSHLASKSTFASVFASNCNIVSVAILTLVQRMDIEPSACLCILLPLLLLFLKSQTQTLTLSVNGPYESTCCPIERIDGKGMMLACHSGFPVKAFYSRGVERRVP